MANTHIVSAYDEELRGLSRAIADMGGRAEELVENGVASLLRGDVKLAREAIHADRAVNRLRQEIEEKAVLTIAKRQPLASDLREIISAIRISNDLERVADLGKNIARRAIAIDGQPMSAKLFTGVEHLAELGLTQLKRVLDAYGAHDVAAARAVWAEDDAIDAMYVSLFREMLTYMMEDPRNISMCTHLLFCAKNIERIGDHATNIAETVHYLVTGSALEETRARPNDRD